MLYIIQSDQILTNDDEVCIPSLSSIHLAVCFEFEFFLILTKLIGVLLLFRAPTDCLQYYTTTSGEVKSFNFGSGLMTNLRYDVCIRESVGKNDKKI